jgi:hypothetical protein
LIKKTPPWKLMEGRVDLACDHFEIRLAEGDGPVARVGRGAEREFVFEYTRAGADAGDAGRAKVRGDLRFELIEKDSRDPWQTARDRARTADDSEVRWGWVPGPGRRVPEAQARGTPHS